MLRSSWFRLHCERTSLRQAAPARTGVWALGFLTLGALLATPATALNYVNGYVPDVHNRFLPGTFEHGQAGDPPPTVAPTPNPNVWASQYDFSGVGWATNRSFRHVAMISPSHFVNANHAPLTNHKISFVNQSGDVHTFQAGPATQVSGDLAVSTLTTLSGDPVDVTDYGITYYPLYSADANFYDERPVLRYGAEGRTQWENDQDNPDQGPRLALSKVYQASATNNAVYMTSGNTNMALADQAHAATPVVGDSGSPVFYVHNGALTLMATTWTTSAGAFLGVDIPALDAYMAAEGYSLTVLEGDADGFSDITSPAELEEVEGTIDIVGTIADADMDHWTLEVYDGELEWSVLATSKRPVIGDVIYSGFDTNALDSGRNLLRITVTDTSGDETSSVRWFVSGLPRADAGPDQGFDSLPKGINLDGRMSYDPNGTIESYYWEEIDGPGTILDDPTSPNPTATFPAWFQDPGSFTVAYQLTVTDDDGFTASDEVEIEVRSEGGNEK